MDWNLPNNLNLYLFTVNDVNTLPEIEVLR